MSQAIQSLLSRKQKAPLENSKSLSAIARAFSYLVLTFAKPQRKRLINVDTLSIEFIEMR